MGFFLHKKYKISNVRNPLLIIRGDDFLFQYKIKRKRNLKSYNSKVASLFSQTIRILMKLNLIVFQLKE